MTALPATIDTTSTAIRDAYARCKELETVLSTESSTPNLIHLRIVGFLLLEGPSLAAKEWTASSVLLCLDDDFQVIKFGELLDRHFLRCFRPKMNEGWSPRRSRYSPKPTFEESVLATLRDSPPQDHSQAKKLTLIRDSHRCVLSRAMDDAVIEDYPALFPSGSGVVRIRFTNCAYIFDESLNVLSTATVIIARKEYATNFCMILGYMGFPGMLDELQGAGVHSLRNTMTLSNQLHRYFDSFRLWLEETETPNRYKVRIESHTEEAVAQEGVPPFVTFVAAHKLDLPSPEYLRIHASCCRIACLSGAAEWYRKLERDEEDCSASVADDVGGTFGDVLMDKLAQVQ